VTSRTALLFLALVVLSGALVWMVRDDPRLAGSGPVARGIALEIGVAPAVIVKFA
jgi:hypothetical protein